MSLRGAATEEDGNLIAILFGSVGKICKADEKYFDAVTGLTYLPAFKSYSGSGLAYLYLAIGALAGGVAAGLPRDLALGLASQTVLGAASMATKTGKHPGQLKDDVTLPGGTTIAGIHELERGGFRGLLMNSVVAATKRSRELSFKSLLQIKEEELALILFSDGCATLQFINSCATMSDNGQAALIQQDLFLFEN
ncbi:hypothetical protein TIFTF001_052964 [Ficus carica]|uniref:Pyrroline-5-carboxylate reductase dimerisation domain-containing protein n=1 Tax=Ficus carica TaxID=3494 RepID=A0AA88EED2_FICCA|nr:hypothetical protein TIFTF001_052964 [Ficus carica]